MKKWWAIVPLSLMLAACSDDNSFEFNDIKTEESQEDTSTTTEMEDQESAETVEEEQGSEVEEDAEVVEEETDESKEEAEAGTVKDNTQNAVVENKGLVQYMPKRAIKKTFLLEEFEIVREVTAVKGNRMLETITFGDVVTKQVSEWTPTKLTMLFNNAEGVEDVTIDNFESTTAPEVYIDKLNEQKGPQAWKVIDEKRSLTIPAGSYKDVLVIEQTITSETSSQETITRYYYGKGLGVIKEETITKNGDEETSYVMEMNKVE